MKLKMNEFWAEMLKVISAAIIQISIFNVIHISTKHFLFVQNQCWPLHNKAQLSSVVKALLGYANFQFYAILAYF
jgi:hypothetical protein